MPTTVEVGTGSVDGFFARGRELARALDAGHEVPESIVIEFVHSEDLLQLLTPERRRILAAVKEHPGPVKGIAAAVCRRPDTVRKDVRMLCKYGLLRIRKRTNPGHGQINWIEPAAHHIELRASL